MSSKKYVVAPLFRPIFFSSNPITISTHFQMQKWLTNEKNVTSESCFEMENKFFLFASSTCFPANLKSRASNTVLLPASPSYRTTLRFHLIALICSGPSTSVFGKATGLFLGHSTALWIASHSLLLQSLCKLNSRGYTEVENNESRDLNEENLLKLNFEH